MLLEPSQIYNKKPSDPCNILISMVRIIAGWFEASIEGVTDKRCSDEQLTGVDPLISMHQTQYPPCYIDIIQFWFLLCIAIGLETHS